MAEHSGYGQRGRRKSSVFKGLRCLLIKAKKVFLLFRFLCLEATLCRFSPPALGSFLYEMTSVGVFLAADALLTPWKFLRKPDSPGLAPGDFSSCVTLGRSGLLCLGF